MVESAYDEIAEWYDAWAGTTIHDDAFFPAVEALMGDVAGQRVCDLACGQGRVTRRLADLGAHVVGLDISAGLLRIARRHERSPTCGPMRRGLPPLPTTRSTAWFASRP